MKQTKRLVILLLAVLLLIGAAFARFHLLGAQSFWNDEGSSYVQATRMFADIASNAARDIHPPGYYWLLAIWRLLFGETEFALRALSAFASVITLALTYAVGGRLHGRWIGLVAASFVTLNTFSIYYAQEARMYALLALWVVAAFWALIGFTRVVEQRHIAATSPMRGATQSILPWAAVLALINAAGLWTHYAYPFFMLVQGVIFLLWWFADFRRAFKSLLLYTLANGITMILFAAWLPTALERVTSWPNTGAATDTAEGLRVIFGWLAFGITFEASGATALLFAVIFLLLFGLVVRSRAPQPRGIGMIAVLLPVLWVLFPVCLFLALGLFRMANLKFLLPAQIGFALWLARGVGVLWASPVRDRAALLNAAPRIAAAGGAAALLLTAAGGLPFLYHDPAFQRADYRAIAQTISVDPRAGDAVILNAPNQAEVFRYYYRGTAPIFPLPAGLGGDDAAARAQTEQIVADYARIYVLFWGEAERDPNRVVETTLDAQAFEVDNAWYGDVRLARYATPVESAQPIASGAQFGSAITLQSYALSTSELYPGDLLQIHLTWTTSQTLTGRYKVFIHLVDEAGQIVAQRDSEPGGGGQPTIIWQQHVPVEDRHALLIPNDLPPSHYTLMIGLYDSVNPTIRLRLLQSDADTLTLSRISIVIP